MKKRKHKKLVDILIKSGYGKSDFISKHQELLEDIELQRCEDQIDKNIEDLEKKIGRELTEKEYHKLLDIVGEYSPKDKEGTIIFDYIPFDFE